MAARHAVRHGAAGGEEPTKATLLDQYQHVMEAYVDGLEKARDAGHDLSRLHSVASFFVSRVDTEIDKRLEASGAPAELFGKAGIANARLAYQAYEEFFVGDRWESLVSSGANPQRPLWASTGVKNPAYPDTLYITDLVVADTVNTMPEKTMRAFADHGELDGDQVSGRSGAAQSIFDQLAAVGIDFEDVLVVLETEGVDKFKKSWIELTETVTGQMEKAKK